MDIADLVESIDIVDYISQYVELEEKNGEFWGLSPFKDEKTPSFSVRREAGKYYDFSSGHGGNILTFQMRYANASMPEAIESLKAYAGVTDATVFRPRIEASKIAKRYRGIQGSSVKQYDSSALPPDCMDRYEFDKDRLKLWYDEGISYESMMKFGVRYDAFSDRIVYPIRNLSGKIINISGRTCDKDYKEKGLRKYTYFRSAGSVPVIYGAYENMDDIKSQNEIIVFEGAKSVLMADTWGIHNTGAAQTSHLSRFQFEILLRLNVPVSFAFDAEINVMNDENVMRLRHYVPVYWIRNQDDLLENKDSPVDKGKETFMKLYERRIKI